MDENIKIQEEFESLIEQLEKLKKINELTSANTQNTELLVLEFKTFAHKINDFKEFVSNDFNNKSLEINNLTKNLGIAIDSINIQAEGITGRVDESLKNIENEIIKKITDAEKTLNKIINNNQKLNIELSEILKNDSNENQKLIFEKVDTLFKEIKITNKKTFEVLDVFKNETTILIQNTEQNLTTKIDNLKIQDSFALIATNFETVNSSFKSLTKEIIEGNKEIKLKIDANSTHLKNNQEAILKEFTTQKDELTSTKNLLYFTICLVIILITITLTLK